jgi:hypothetical protein
VKKGRKWIKTTGEAKYSYRTKRKDRRKSLRAEERKLGKQDRSKLRKREEYSLLGCDTV